jgi:hypothetical protein
VIVSSEY